MMPFRGIVPLLVLFCLACPSLVMAGDLVTGRYLDTGQEVRVELTIGEPAPASIILVQKFPGGAGLTGSRPEVKMYSPAKGEAKWLLSRIVSGKVVVEATLDRAVARQEVSGEIRYRDESGNMVTVAVD